MKELLLKVLSMIATLLKHLTEHMKVKSFHVGTLHCGKMLMVLQFFHLSMRKEQEDHLGVGSRSHKKFKENMDHQFPNMEWSSRAATVKEKTTMSEVVFLRRLA
jgi:hypothetical protein